MKLKRLLIYFASFLAVSTSFSQSRIIGGETVNITERPYQVALIEEGSGFFCGGTIIDEEWILTASHCLEDLDETDVIQVLTGNSLSSDSEGLKEVEEFFMHSEYDPITLDNDIALIKLASPLRLSASIQTIDLLTQEDIDNGLIDPGVLATVSGWGITDEGTTSDTLKSVDVPIVDFDVANSADSYDGELTENMIAAGYQEGGSDACQGDSGGPLVVPNDDDSDVILAGVVSFGNGCGDENFYGIYTNVAMYTDWINDIIGGLPLANFNISEILKVNETGYTENLTQNNATSYQWTINAGNEEVFTSEEETIEFSLDSVGEYTATLIAENDLGTDTVSTNIIILENSDDCSIYGWFDPSYQSLYILENDTITSTNSYDYFGVEFYNDDFSIVEIESIEIGFENIEYFSGDSTKIIIYLGEGDEYETHYFILENFVDNMDENGIIEFPLDEPLYISPYSVFYIEVDLANFYFNYETVVLNTSYFESIQPTSYLYNYETEDFDYIYNYDLAISYHSCNHDLDALLYTNDQQNDLNVHVFPNPTEGTINIENYEEGTFTLYTVTGEVLTQFELQVGVNKIDLPALPSNIYSWQIICQTGKSKSGKLMIK